MMCCRALLKLVKWRSSPHSRCARIESAASSDIVVLAVAAVHVESTCFPSKVIVETSRKLMASSALSAVSAAACNHVLIHKYSFAVGDVNLWLVVAQLLASAHLSDVPYQPHTNPVMRALLPTHLCLFMLASDLITRSVNRMYFCLLRWHHMKQDFRLFGYLKNSKV